MAPALIPRFALVATREAVYVDVAELRPTRTAIAALASPVRTLVVTSTTSTPISPSEATARVGQRLSEGLVVAVLEHGDASIGGVADLSVAHVASRYLTRAHARDRRSAPGSP